MTRMVRYAWLCLFSLNCITSALSQELVIDSLPIEALKSEILKLDTVRDVAILADIHRELGRRQIYEFQIADEAIYHFSESGRFYWTAGDTISYFATLIDLSRFYESIRKFDEANSILIQMQSRFESTGDSIMLTYVLSELADLKLVNQDVEGCQEVLQLIKKINVDPIDPVINTVISFTQSTINKEGDNKDIITDSIEVLLNQRIDTSNVNNYMSTLLMNNGYYYMAEAEYDLAIHYFSKAVEQAGRNVERRKEAYRFLAQCYKVSGQYESAFEFLDRYTYLNDSVFQASRLELLEGLTVKNAQWEQRQKVMEMNRDRNIAEFKSRIRKLMNYGLLLGAMIMLVVSYLIIRNYQNRLNTNQIISKQNAEITKRRITDLENNLKIETMHSMLAGQEAERERIAKDLHDSLGGLLSTVKLHFDAVQTKKEDISSIKEYETANRLLDEACKEIRNISNNMQPGALLKLGIVPAINDLVNRLQSGGRPVIDFQHFGINGNLDDTISLNIYRIIQELIYNSIKHASSSEILVQLVKKDDEIILMVEDDGIGFDSEEVKIGMGTENIASRVNYLKGDLSVHSVKGTGTTTLINIPLAVEA